MSMRIYTMTHKKFTPLPDPLYVPLHVGRACGENLGYLGDDTGEQISALNCYYSASTEQVNVTMEEISEHTETLQAIAKDLMETINRFKLA